MQHPKFSRRVCSNSGRIPKILNANSQFVASFVPILCYTASNNLVAEICVLPQWLTVDAHYHRRAVASRQP